MKVDQITHSRDMVIQNFLRAGSRLFDLVQSEVDPFDLLSPKTLL